MTGTAAALSYGEEPRVLLIGTSESSKDPGNLPPLPHVRNNLDELKRLFCDPDVIGLPSEAVTVLLDIEYASAVTDAIRDAAQEARGTLLVYYAGHGLYGDADQPLYLCAKKTSDEGKAANGIPIKTVRRLIANAAGADRRILILDCCYAGAAFQEGMNGAEAKAEIKNIIDIEGTYGIAAVPGNYKALAPKGEKLTRFTRELVNILEHGLANKGDMLTLETVFEATRKGLSQAGIEPPVRVASGEVDRFLFARNRWRPEVNVAKLSEAVDKISNAVEGIRTTVAQYGSTLAQIERRLGAVEALPNKVVEPESPDGSEINSNVHLKKEAIQIWHWCGVSQLIWEEWPQWVQGRVIAYRSSARSSRLILIIAALMLIFFMPLPMSDVYIYFPFRYFFIYGPMPLLLTVSYLAFLFLSVIWILMSVFKLGGNKYLESGEVSGNYQKHNESWKINERVQWALKTRLIHTPLGWVRLTYLICSITIVIVPVYLLLSFYNS